MNKIKNNKKITSMTKTILFAGLIMTLMVPVAGMNIFADTNDSKIVLENSALDTTEIEQKLLDLVPSDKCEQNILANKNKHDSKINIEKNINDAKLLKDFKKHTTDKKSEYIATLTEYDVDKKKCDVMLKDTHNFP